MAPPSTGKWIQIRVTLTATLAVFSCGMQFSWSSPALEKLESENLFHLTNDEISWAVSLLNIGALCGSVLSGFIVDVIGRKWCIFATNGPYIVGWILIYFATSSSWLYAARTIAGLAAGMSLNAVPMYVCEIASVNMRGCLCTLCMVMTNMGVLFQYVCGPFLTYHILAIASCAVAVVSVVSMFFVPESPAFLLTKERYEDARRSLEILRGSSAAYSDVDEELNTVKDDINDRKRTVVSWTEAFRSPGYGKALLIVSFLGLMQQMCGNAALLAYFQGIYNAANSHLELYQAYIIVGVLQVCSGLLSSWTVDQSGRKPLFLISCILEIIAYSLMGGFFFLKDYEHITMDSVSWLPLALIAIVLVSFNLGQGPLVYVFVGEILPLEVRAIGATSAALCISFGSFGSTKIYPLVEPYTAFWLFDGLVFITALFCFILIPETKGKTSDEIRQLMDKGRTACINGSFSSSTLDVVGK